MVMLNAASQTLHPTRWCSGSALAPVRWQILSSDLLRATPGQLERLGSIEGHRRSGMRKTPSILIAWQVKKFGRCFSPFLTLPRIPIEALLNFAVRISLE